MREFTKGWSAKKVEESSDNVVKLMNLLKDGAEEPFHASGPLQIISGRVIAGALLTLNGTQLNFPYGGLTYTTDKGLKHKRIAKKLGDTLRLTWEADGTPEIASISTWIVDLPAGKISFSMKEASYWQVSDYGRVVRNQIIEAVGTLQ
jgi:hypothetical protein